MMLLPILLLAPVAAPPVDEALRARHVRCVALVASDPAAAVADATAWGKAGGRFFAQQCLGLAQAARQQWLAAAIAFEDAARTAATASDARAANYWAQAGNAWLASGDAKQANIALTAALADPALDGTLRGEAELDRARALVATGDRDGARAAIDRAIPLAGDDPLTWLLSATLARQMGQGVRAKADIAQALQRSPDDPSVQLEAGNIAAATGDEAGAKAAWAQVVRLRSDSPQAKAAEVALAQFD